MSSFDAGRPPHQVGFEPPAVMSGRSQRLRAGASVADVSVVGRQRDVGPGRDSARCSDRSDRRCLRFAPDSRTRLARSRPIRCRCGRRRCRSRRRSTASAGRLRRPPSPCRSASASPRASARNRLPLVCTRPPKLKFGPAKKLRSTSENMPNWNTGMATVSRLRAQMHLAAGRRARRHVHRVRRQQRDQALIRTRRDRLRPPPSDFPRRRSLTT